MNGRAIKAVAVPTKEAFLYVFDRVTGQPVWPIEERPVPKGDVPGEWYAPRSRSRPGRRRTRARRSRLDDLNDFTPAMHEQALKNFQRTDRTDVPATALSKVGGPLAALTIGTTAGGTNWPGAAYDPETTSSSRRLERVGRAARSCRAARWILRYSLRRGNRRTAVRRARGPGRQRPKRHSAAAAAPAQPPPNPLQIEGLSILKPPYGLLSAIDLDKGEIKWQVPHGDTPDGVRNHPALKGMTIPKTGQNGAVGAVVTKTLVIMGDPLVTTTPEHPRGAMLRVRQGDRRTGRSEADARAAKRSPMTYMVNGCSSSSWRSAAGTTPASIAFSLPAEALAARSEMSGVRLPGLPPLARPCVIAAWPSDVRAGQAAPAASVWAGVYTGEQANRGAVLYREACASCHGPTLLGGEMAPALVGTDFMSNWNGLTVGDLVERIRVSMPQNDPGA